MKYKIIPCLLFVCFTLSACFMLPIEDPVPPPPITRVLPVRNFRTATVTRGDVVFTNTMSAFLVPSHEERLAFSLDGLPIYSINVDVGDEVRAGDVLAVLSWPDIETRLTQSRTQLDRLNLDLVQTHQRLDNALFIASQLSVPADDSSFMMSIARLEREIALLTTEHEYLNNLNNQRYLISPIDGTINHIVNFFQGMLSNTMQTLISVVDQAQSIFEVRHSDAAELMRVDDLFEIVISGETHTLIVVDPDVFGVVRNVTDDAFVYLAFYGDVPVLGNNQRSGSITLVIDTSLNTLRIPIRALNMVGDRNFVFVVNEEGNREIRDVVIGLRGNLTQEIISGLAEGEVVIDE